MPKSCPYCAASMGIKAIYCPRCGKKQPRLEQQEAQRQGNGQPKKKRPQSGRPANSGRKQQGYEQQPKKTTRQKPTKLNAARTQPKDSAAPRPAAERQEHAAERQTFARADGVSIQPVRDTGLVKLQPIPSTFQNSKKPMDKRLWLLALIPVVLLGAYGLSRAASNKKPEETPPVAQVFTPAPTATPSPTPEPTPEPTPTPEPMKLLAELMDEDRARAYSMFTVTDDRANDIPAFSTLLPKGWTGSGGVIWDFQSADSPGRYVFYATSPDGSAGITLSSSMSFVNVRSYDMFSGQPVIPGLPEQPVMSHSDIAMQYIPSLNGGMSQVNISGSEQAESGDAQAGYTTRMEPVFSALHGMGLNVQNPYVTASQLRGGLVYQGRQCDMVSDIITSGYSCVQEDIWGNTEIDYWNLEYICTYYAPTGEIDAIMPDMQLIMDNFHVNEKWLKVKDTVSAQINSYINQQQDDSALDYNSFGEQSLINTGIQADQNESYQKLEILEKVDFYAAWPTEIRNRRSWQGEVFPVSIEDKWQHIWLSGTGDVIATTDEEYNPAEDETQMVHTWKNVSDDGGAQPEEDDIDYSDSVIDYSHPGDDGVIDADIDENFLDQEGL